MTVPVEKRVLDTQFTVDAFRYQSPHIRHYFLSHFHGDHYTGMTKNFQYGKIYCTDVTADLAKRKFEIEEKFFVRLQIDETVEIEGVKVTALDANHCPGSCLFFFELEDGRTALHTGDFRYHPRMKTYKLLCDKEVNTLYLDTTYCNRKYTFPPQEETIAEIVRLVKDELQLQDTLVMVGTYGIGKERVLLGISKALDQKIHVTKDKFAILSLLGMGQDMHRFVEDESLPVHATTLFDMTTAALNSMAQKSKTWKRIVGVRATGWSFRPTGTKISRNEWGRAVVYGVPYSEHSSYNELMEFVTFLKPDRIVPTVNCRDQRSIDRMLIALGRKPSSSISTFFSSRAPTQADDVDTDEEDYIEHGDRCEQLKDVSEGLMALEDDSPPKEPPHHSREEPIVDRLDSVRERRPSVKHGDTSAHESEFIDLQSIDVEEQSRLLRAFEKSRQLPPGDEGFNNSTKRSQETLSPQSSPTTPMKLKRSKTTAESASSPTAAAKQANITRFFKRTNTT